MIGKWTQFVIGIIMIISPWVLGFSDVSLAKWCNVLIGLVLVIMNAWIIFGEAPMPVSAEESKKDKNHKK